MWPKCKNTAHLAYIHIPEVNLPEQAALAFITLHAPENNEKSSSHVGFMNEGFEASHVMKRHYKNIMEAFSQMKF